MLKAQEVEQFKVRGCLSKPKKSQYYQAILIYTDDAGEEYRVSRSTKESSKIKAQKVMLDMAAELEERLHRTDPSSLFADFMEYWLREVICNEVEVPTLNGYRMNLENHIIPYFKPLQLRLRDLRAVHLTQFCEEMSHKKKADGNLLSGSSIKKLYSNLRTALDYAVTHELIDQNPARIAKAPKAQAYEASYLSIPQITSLWKGCKGSIIEPAVFLTSIYGFRRGEICGLRWENVDIPQRNLRIYETRTQAQGVITKGTKNSASKRTMPIPEAVADYLLLLQERQREAKQAGGEYWCESGYVVIDECGKPISIARLNKHFTRLLERCGLPKVRFHDLRHSVATYFLELGIPIAEISAWLGHGSIATTEKIYAHVNKETRMNASRTLDKLMGYQSEETPRNIEGALRELFEPMLSKVENGDQTAESRSNLRSNQAENEVQGV